MTRTVQVQKVYMTSSGTYRRSGCADAQRGRRSKEILNQLTLLITPVLISIALPDAYGMVYRYVPLPDRLMTQYACRGDCRWRSDSPYHHRMVHETGVPLQALMAMKTRLLDIVQKCKRFESISTAAAQIVAGNRDLAARTEEQATGWKKRRRRWNRLPPRLKHS